MTPGNILVLAGYDYTYIGLSYPTIGLSRPTRIESEWAKRATSLPRCWSTWDDSRNQPRAGEFVHEQFSTRTRESLLAIQIHASELSLAEAVSTYLFNSQIVTDSDGGWRMICPSACQASESVQSFLTRLLRTVTRLKQIDYVHLQQSMANGGGPACLRLRVILDEEQIRQLPKSSIVTEDVANRLQSIIEAEYPTHVTMSDLMRLDFAAHAEHIANQIANVWRL